MTRLLALAVLFFGVRAPARAADEDPERVVMADTNSDPGKVFRARGGPDKAAVRGGAVIIDAAGNRLEIAPTKRLAPEILPTAAPMKLALPVLPTLDDPKAGLPERRRRAQLLLAGSAAAAFLLLAWARRRWRPDV